MSVSNESQISHCSGPVLLNSVTGTPNEYASHLSWAVDQLRSDGRVKAIVCHCVAGVSPRRRVETRCEAGQENGLDLQLLDDVQVPSKNGPVQPTRILQDPSFELVDDRTPGHLVFEWAGDSSPIGRCSGSPSGGTSQGGSPGSGNLRTLLSAKRRLAGLGLVEEDSQSQPPPYTATSAIALSDPDLQPPWVAEDDAVGMGCTVTHKLSVHDVRRVSAEAPRNWDNPRPGLLSPSPGYKTPCLGCRELQHSMVSREIAPFLASVLHDFAILPTSSVLPDRVASSSIPVISRKHLYFRLLHGPRDGDESWPIRASTVRISLSATGMWAVLYHWTPEIFATPARVSIPGGLPLMANITRPVYTHVVVFLTVAICLIMLKEELRGKSWARGEVGLSRCTDGLQ
ncbi:hypothetical protein BKA70DRAFT_1410683 [Coprinopsis sp. MPI-PUGE-AT-0042]|nr:hypothetical protein BKA70DRAFT_1410683 [Coprinopsis sp. MPI-PUGE-AT-0042]